MAILFWGKSTLPALLTAINDCLEMMESGMEAAAVFFFLTLPPKHLNLCPTKI